MQLTKIRKIIIGLMLAFYLAVITCDKSYYFSYNSTYHSIVLEDDPYILLLDGIVEYHHNFQPGRFVKQPASFYSGLNMMKINDYRFSLN